MTLFNKGKLVCERYILGALDVNTYLLYEENTKECLIIDPAAESERLVDKIIKLGIKKVNIFLTHGHIDHICGIDFYKKLFPESKVLVSVQDATMLTDSEKNLSVWLGEPFSTKEADLFLSDSDIVEVGSMKGIVKLVPGHTEGGLVLVFDDMVFSGDTLFAGSVGRSDFPGGSHSSLLSGIKKNIFSLSDRLVFPGHGPETTIETEKVSNPFFN
ncbi:MAG: MBL fold metallo-hydrolase [Candidatus Riflebacteria bacterium]|nr:MBL fold metallo-hydrolase [Candidatus Riflebacteria bacterium]